MTFIGVPEQAEALAANGVTMFFVASEQSWIMEGARSVADALKN